MGVQGSSWLGLRLCWGRVSGSKNAAPGWLPQGMCLLSIIGFHLQVTGIRQFPSGGRAGTRIPTGAVGASGREGGHCWPCRAQPH